MEIKISTSNTKLGYQIPSISLSPECSCRKDAPCAKGCYGKKGHFTYSNVKDSQKHNYEVYVNAPETYFKDIISYLNDSLISYKYFRWHTVGDIVDMKYFQGMVEVAEKCKQVKFLCFTKKFDIVNTYLKEGGKIPSNLKILFSAWHNAFKVDNPYNFPVAYVFFKRKELNPDINPLAIPCEGHCPECLACWSLKKGQAVVFNQH